VWNNSELNKLARFVGRNADEFRTIETYIKKPNDHQRRLPVDIRRKIQAVRASHPRKSGNVKKHPTNKAT